MPSTFDKDLVGFGDELESQDPYTAASETQKRSSSVNASGVSSLPDDEEEDEDGPSVEEEIAKQESGTVHPPEPVSEEEDELAKERKASDELLMIEELAGEMESERDELFNKEDEES